MIQPDYTLQRIRQEADAVALIPTAARATLLADLIGALDEHLTNGGRLPEAWAPAAFSEREAARTEAIAGHLPTDVPSERCPVWLGHDDDEGGSHRCAGPAEHAGRQHDARKGSWA